MVTSKIKERLRSLEYVLLWKIATWAIERSESRYLLSPAVKYHNEGYLDACRFIEENLKHFVWGHPEMTTKDYAAWVEYERQQWEPEE